MFGKKSRQQFVPVPTELTQQWFHDWAVDTLRRKGEAVTVDSVADLWHKACQVIDHDCRDYIQRHCARDATAHYLAYCSSDAVVPWDLVSVVVGCNPSERNWPSFIVGDARSKIARFTEILIDPSVAQ